MAAARKRVKGRTRGRYGLSREGLAWYLQERRRHRLNLALRGDNDRVTADSEAWRADHGAGMN